jgi:hypothetical protein
MTPGVRGEGPKWGLGVSSASSVWIGENFTKQKTRGAPDLVEADHVIGPIIQILKDLGTRWSHGQ